MQNTYDIMAQCYADYKEQFTTRFQEPFAVIAPLTICQRTNSVLRSETNLLPEVKEWCDDHISYTLTDVWRKYNWIDWACPENYPGYHENDAGKEIVWDYLFCFVAIHFTTAGDWLAFKLRWLSQPEDTHR